MSEQKAQENQQSKAPQKGQKGRSPTRPQRGKKQFDTSELATFLETINVGVTPTIHVNGTSNPTAVITVDFGSPIQSVRLSQDQVQDLMTRMRKTSREMFSHEVNIRVSSDHQNGIFWASVT
jgi:hypothetical protein